MKKLKKKSGNSSIIVIVITSIMLFILFIVGVVVLESYRMSAQKEILQDGIVMSALGGLKDIDLHVLAESEKTEFKIKTDEAYKTFLRNLKINLDLDNNLNPKQDLIFGKINIDNFNIYNVSGNQVIEYSLNTNNNSFNVTGSGSVGRMKTPKGNTIEASTINVKASFKVKNIFGKEQQVSLSQDVDITN